MSLHSKAIRLAYLKGYRVDAEGVIRSPLGRVLSVYIPPNRPYPRVSFRLEGFGNYKFDLHRFVAFQRYGFAAFACGIHARHVDDNPQNCRPSNIILGTQSQNEMDKSTEVRRRSAFAAAKKRRRLTDEQVRQVPIMVAQGARGKAIAAALGVSESTISEILSGKLYSEVTGIQQRPRTRHEVPEHLREVA